MVISKVSFWLVKKKATGGKVSGGWQRKSKRRRTGENKLRNGWFDLENGTKQGVEDHQAYCACGLFAFGHLHCNETRARTYVSLWLDPVDDVSISGKGTITHFCTSLTTVYGKFFFRLLLQLNHQCNNSKKKSKLWI